MSSTHLNSGTVNLVVALADEAQPLVDHFSLTLEANHEPFRVYTGDGVRLIVAGVGKLAAAAAVGYLYRWGGNRRDEAWLNVGIAGHAQLPLGTIRLAHKVTDESSAKRWYPPRILSAECPSCDIRCVDRPDNEYLGKAMVDMESAGFVAAASRLATSELVQLAKIISDNREAPAARVTRQTIRGLVHDHVDLTKHLMTVLRDLSAEQIRRAAPTLEFNRFRKRWHFTATQSSQLRELLRRWEALRPGEPVMDTISCQTTSRSVLRALRQILDETAVRIGHE